MVDELAGKKSITVEQAIEQIWDKLEIMEEKLDRILEKQEWKDE